jgi:hypothetical protein
VAAQQAGRVWMLRQAVGSTLAAFSRPMTCRQWERASSVQSRRAGEPGRKILIRESARLRSRASATDRPRRNHAMPVIRVVVPEERWSRRARDQPVSGAGSPAVRGLR